MSSECVLSAVEANISLFIPLVFTNFDQEYIANAFKDIGEVDHVDLVARVDRKGKYYNSVYVHFKHWHNTTCAQEFYEKVVSEHEQARLYHDGRWFWIVLPNYAKKHVPGERKPRIELDGVQTISYYVVEPPQPQPEQEPVVLEELNPFTEVEEGEITVQDDKDKDDDDEDEFEDYPEYYDELHSIEAKMDETEQVMMDVEEEDDMHLVSIDVRYVRTIEEENSQLAKYVQACEYDKYMLNAEIEQLREALIRMDIMYQAEAAKVRAFMPTW